jgi:hypothetical protein
VLCGGGVLTSRPRPTAGCWRPGRSWSPT